MEYSKRAGFKGTPEELKAIIEDITGDDTRAGFDPRFPVPVFSRSILPEHLDRTIKDREKRLRLGMHTVRMADFDIYSYAEYSRPIQAIINEFRAYMKACYSNPIYNHFKVQTKTGNEEHYTRLKNRFMSNRNVLDVLQRFQNLKQDIPAVFLTLTYDRTSSPGQTWEKSAGDWNRFYTRLKAERKKQGLSNDFEYLYVLEAQESGHAHIHALIMGPGLLDGSPDGKPYLYWNGNAKDFKDAQARYSKVKSLEAFWKNGFTYVNKSKDRQDIRSPIGYMFKYLLKTFYYSKATEEYTDKDRKKDLLGKAFLHAYRKRSFNKSRGLIAFLEANYKETFDVELTEEPETEQLSIELFKHVSYGTLTTRVIINRRSEGYHTDIVEPKYIMQPDGKMGLNPEYFDEFGRPYYIEDKAGEKLRVFNVQYTYKTQAHESKFFKF